MDLRIEHCSSESMSTGRPDTHSAGEWWEVWDGLKMVARFGEQDDAEDFAATLKSEDTE